MMQRNAIFYVSIVFTLGIVTSVYLAFDEDCREWTIVVAAVVLLAQVCFCCYFVVVVLVVLVVTTSPSQAMRALSIH
jgi:hypothetical protein